MKATKERPITTQVRNERNGVDLNVLQETIDAIQNDPEMGRAQFRATNAWIEGTRNRTRISGFYGAKQEIAHDSEFRLQADEPALLAGTDNNPNPVEHLLNALASCVTTSMVAHAAVRGIEIESLESTLEGDIDLRGFLGLDPDVPKGYTNIRITFKARTDRKNLKKLRELAEYSPVYNSLMEGVKVDLEVEEM